MLKHSLSNILLVLALLVPMTVFSQNDNAIDDKQVVTQLSASVNVVATLSDKETASILAAQPEEIKSSSAHNNKIEPLLTDNWLILLSLLGFVMLSNRSGV